jgi:hypothetical protein
MANKQLNKLDQAEYYAALCFANTITRKNINQAQQFYKLLKDDFNKDPFQIIIESKDKFLLNKEK